MFRGTFEHTIDDKGRVSVPSRFREVLQASNDERVVITNYFVGTLRCLEVYGVAAWQQLEERLQEKPQFDPRLVRFQNYYVAAAQDCVIDKQGRILLPPSLREYAGLDRDVVFTSGGAKFRIWDLVQWKKVFGDAERELMERPEDLEWLGI